MIRKKYRIGDKSNGFFFSLGHTWRHSPIQKSSLVGVMLKPGLPLSKARTVWAGLARPAHVHAFIGLSHPCIVYGLQMNRHRS